MRGIDFVMVVCSAAICLPACNPGGNDLVIENAALFDSRTGTVRPNCTVVISGGEITAVREGKDAPGRVVIDAAGRLLAPGLIDVHHHSASILADSISSTGGFITDLDMHPDSVAAYRRVFAAAYLPFGVTAVREAGGDEHDLAMMQAWTVRAAQYPDFYPSGGAMVSHEEGRTPYQGHAVVRDPADAAAKVQAYYEAGLRHIKLYWRLRQPEFDAALRRARELDMNVCGHIDYKVVSIDHALSMGLRHFEHAYTLIVEVLSEDELAAVWNGTAMRKMRDGRGGLFFFYIMELCNSISADDDRLTALIDRLRSSGATVTPTLHIFAQRLGLSHFTSAPGGDFEDTSEWTQTEMSRARAGYRALARLVKRLFDAGVPLSVGTDSTDPGHAVLSEMLLLHDAGIPMRDVLRSATLGGARAIGMDVLYGSVEAGKRANLVLFDANPLQDPQNLLSGKTVVKDGTVWAP